MSARARLRKALGAAEWILNAGVLAYAVLFLATLWRGGDLFEFDFLGVHVSASDPGKPLAILFGLVFVRFCLSLEKKNLALFLSSILFAGLLAEGLLRVLPVPLADRPALSAWRRPSPTLGYELIPGLSGRAASRYEVSVNSQGLRDRERPIEKPPGVVRVVALGDSFTFGMGLPAQETYVRRLEGLLRGRGLPADVVNGGVIGYNLYQSLTWFKDKGVRYQPDLVIYFFFMDDAEGCNNPECVRHYYDEAVSGRIKEYRKPAVEGATRSHLYNFIVNVYTQFANRLRFLTVDWIRTVERRREHFDRLNRSFLTDAGKVAVFSQNLASLQAAVTGSGAKLLVVLVPDAAQLFNPPMQNTNRVLSGLCRGFGIPFLDMTEVFERETDVSRLYLFPVDAHTSARGDAVIASEVLEKIRADRLLPFPAPRPAPAAKGR